MRHFYLAAYRFLEEKNEGCLYMGNHTFNGLNINCWILITAGGTGNNW
jgi:hypothetical protein